MNPDAPSLQAVQAIRDEIARRELALRDETDPDLRAAIQAKLTKLYAAISGDTVLGDAITRDKIGQQFNLGDGTVIMAQAGAIIYGAGQAVTMTAVDPKTAPGKYLEYLIRNNRYLKLKGLPFRGKAPQVELDRIYVTLQMTRPISRATRDDRTGRKTHLMHDDALGPEGEIVRNSADTTVTVNEAMRQHRKLVIKGEPGSGKTTLLSFLALLYARDRANASHDVQTRLGLDESGYLPVLLQLRRISNFLKEHQPNNDGAEGHAVLFRFLHRLMQDESLPLPNGFFDEALESGRAVILLDGLDEVPDQNQRERVSRLIEAFARHYPDCRYVVTSRIKSYDGAVKLQEGFEEAEVSPFSRADMAAFLAQWHWFAAADEFGEGERANKVAQAQTQSLLQSLDANTRVRRLGSNPLLLTVIAIVHREHARLPDRRHKLYEEAIKVLLEMWDRGKDTQVELLLRGAPLELDRKLRTLQTIALKMQEQNKKEADLAWLKAEILAALQISGDPIETDRWASQFVQLIEERSGIWMARDEGVYAFSHLTFQEYLAARAIAAGDHFEAYALPHTGEESWREVILLLAGCLTANNSTARPARLIQAIMHKKPEPAPYHNLVLAAECLRDVGSGNVDGHLEKALRNELQRELDTPVERGRLAAVTTLLKRGMTKQAAIERRIAAAEALGQVGGHQFWSWPHGEPDWVIVPAGVFWMGDEKGAGRVNVSEYQIARVPITNMQYRFFVEATGHETPSHWKDGDVPKGKENHPVVCVDLHDANKYCKWLSTVINKHVAIPNEAQC